MGEDNIYSLQLIGKLNDLILNLESSISDIAKNPILPQTGTAYTLADNFGIGTSTPSVRLEVNGDTIIDGNLTIKNDINVDGNINGLTINGSDINITNNVNASFINTDDINIDSLVPNTVLLSDNTKKVVSSSILNDGQFIIGQTGDIPIVGNLTSIGGSVIISNLPGSINIEAVGGGGGGNVFNNIIILNTGNVPSGIQFTGANPYISSTHGLNIDTSKGVNISQNTLNQPVQTLTSETTNDNPIESIYQGRVGTTNNTPTILHTFTIPASTTYAIDAVIIARRTGGTSGTAENGGRVHIEAVYNNIGGNATVIGTVSKLTSFNDISWNADITTSGNQINIIVTGALNNNITWHHTTRVYYLSS